MSAILSANWFPVPDSTQQQPLQQLPPVAITNTIHISYRPTLTDRGKLYCYFRASPGFCLIGFYESYCFVRFESREHASAALAAPPFGCVTYEAAKLAYKVPYPQPPDEQVPPCKTLHVTHLPPNYTKNELLLIFGVFKGFENIQLHGKYGYAHFRSEYEAMEARSVLRSETNLVVSYAKNSSRADITARKPDPLTFSDLPRIQTNVPELYRAKHFAHQPEFLNGDNIPINMFNSLDLNSSSDSVSEFSFGSRRSSRVLRSPSEQWPDSPPPLSAQSSTPTTPHNNFSEYPWSSSRRSSADSLSSMSPEALELASLTLLNDLAGQNPQILHPSHALQKQLIIQQRLEILRLHILQQQQLYQQQHMFMHHDQSQRKNELRDLPLSFREGFSLNRDVAPETSPYWSPFDSKIGFAIPSARV